MNKSKEIARTNLLYLTLLLPIIIFPYSSAVFEISKTFSIGIGVGILGITFFILQKLKEIKLPNRFILLYFLLYFVSNLFSIDKNLSILGNFPRYNEGDLINLITVLFIILIINFGEKLQLLKIAFYSSFVITTIAVFESFISSERVGSTFGQPNYLGIFIVITIIYQILNFDKLNIKQYLNYGYLIVQVYVLIKTASLTAFFSLIIAILYLLITKKVVLDKVRLLVLGTLISVVVIWQGSILYPKIKDIYFQLTDRSKTTISDSLLIRFALWDTTLKLITSDTKHFFLGSGSNTFIIEFEKNRNNKLDGYSEYYLFYDKPHNYFLEILYSNGVFVFGLFIYLIYKFLKSKNNNKVYIISILIFVFFNWLDIYTRLLFFTVISQSLKTEEIKLKNTKFVSLIYFLLLTVSSAFLFADYRFYFSDYQTENTLIPFNDFYKSELITNTTKNDNDFFFLNKNPIVKVSGLNYYQNSKLEDFKVHLLELYPDNMPIKILIDKSSSN